MSIRSQSGGLTLSNTSCRLERQDLLCLCVCVCARAVTKCCCKTGFFLARRRAGLREETWPCHKWWQSMCCGWTMTSSSRQTPSWRRWWTSWRRRHWIWWDSGDHAESRVANGCMWVDGGTALAAWWGIFIALVVTFSTFRGQWYGMVKWGRHSGDVSMV